MTQNAPDDFRHRYGPWALIAGASEGIGRSFAEQLAERGLNLLLLARRPEVLEAAAVEIRHRHGVQVETHSIDLTAHDLESRIDKIIDEREIGFLVYNAGATHAAHLFHDEPVENSLRLVRLNCVGPMLLSHRLGGAMKARGRGGMVLLSSMAGMVGGAYIAAYAATKAFDIVFASSLWAEMKGFGVDILGLVAGATRTPAAEAAGLHFNKKAQGNSEDVMTMDPDDVVSEALAHMQEGPVWFPGERNKALAPTLRAAPIGTMVERISAKTAGLSSLAWPLGRAT